MPAYNTSGTNSLTPNPVLPTVLMPGDETYLFGTATLTPGQSQKPNDSNVLTEAVTVGERSIAVTLGPRPGGGAPPGMFVQVIANANPGAAEIDVQDAAVDADGAYITPAPSGSTAWKMTTWTQIGGTTNYIGTTALQPEGGHFNTLKIIANPNSVSFTAKLVYV